MISILGRNWEQKKTNKNLTEKLKQDYNFSDIVSKLLNSRKFDETELITIDNTKDNVVAIVSRYYEADSFTSAGSEASVVYTHKGAPLLLSSFKCRILTPEKILAKNIGPDNTIFLEVVKNNLNKKK